MAQLYLIRHAQSGNNALADPRQRTADPDLTRAGLIQASSVAYHLQERQDKTDWRDGRRDLAGHGLRRLYCSPMLRALETTRPIAHALGLAPKIWPDLHEEGGIWLDAGDGRGPVGLPGLGRGELQARYPRFEVPDSVPESGWWDRPIEPRQDMTSRAARVAGALRERLAGAEERVALVSHGTFMSMLIAHLLFGGPVEKVFFGNHNTAISRLDFDGDRVTLRYQNRVEHLTPEQVT